MNRVGLAVSRNFENGIREIPGWTLGVLGWNSGSIRPLGGIGALHDLGLAVRQPSSESATCRGHFHGPFWLSHGLSGECQRKRRIFWNEALRQELLYQAILQDSTALLSGSRIFDLFRRATQIGICRIAVRSARKMDRRGHLSCGQHPL